MRASARLWPALLLCCFIAASALACGGGGGIKSAEAAGKVGARLTAHADAISRSGDLCAYRKALGLTTPGEQDLCPAARASDAVWRRAMRVLGAYGAQLTALSGADAPSVEGAVDASLAQVTEAGWASFSHPERDELKSAVSSLLALVSGTLRQSELASITARAGPHVKRSCSVLTDYLSLQLELVDTEQDAIIHSPLRHTADVGSNLAYLNASLLLRDIRAGYSRAETAIKAFCAAHQRLVETRSLMADDSSYRAVVKAAQDVYAAVKEDE